MPSFPLVGAAYEARSKAFDAQTCINLYPEVSGSGTSRSVAMLLGTPGLDLWATLGAGPIRGVIRFDLSTLIVVSGGQVYKVTTGAAAALIGTVAFGQNPVSMASNGSVIMVVTGGVDGYFINPAAGTVTTITDPDFLGGGNVGFLDGYFIWNVPNTGRFQYSQLYGSGIDALDFATAEGSPDSLVASIVNYRELWLFGENSVEVWYNQGGLDDIFARIQGAFLEVGCAAPNSVAKADNTVFWLGADERGQGVVYRANGYVPQRISTHAIEYAIAQYGTMADAVAYTYSQEGHLFYVLSFPAGNATWVYDAATGLWHERAWRDTSGALNRHRSQCQATFAGLTIVGDWQNGKLYAMKLDTFTDAGDLIPRIRAAPYITNDDNTWQVFDALEVDMQTGVGGTSGAVAVLQWSDDDGGTWSNELQRSMGLIGETVRVRWTRLGKSRARIFKLTITDPVRVAIVGATIRYRRMRA
jgi:hypothetical protein